MINEIAEFYFNRRGGVYVSLNNKEANRNVMVRTSWLKSTVTPRSSDWSSWTWWWRRGTPRTCGVGPPCTGRPRGATSTSANSSWTPSTTTTPLTAGAKTGKTNDSYKSLKITLGSIWTFLKRFFLIDWCLRLTVVSLPRNNGSEIPLKITFWKNLLGVNPQLTIRVFRTHFRGVFGGYVQRKRYHSKVVLMLIWFDQCVGLFRANHKWK